MNDEKFKRPFDPIFKLAAAEKKRAKRAALGFPDISAEVEQCWAELQAGALASRAWANGTGPKPPSPLARMRARKRTALTGDVADLAEYRNKGGWIM